MRQQRNTHSFSHESIHLFIAPSKRLVNQSRTGISFGVRPNQVQILVSLIVGCGALDKSLNIDKPHISAYVKIRRIVLILQGCCENEMKNEV